MKCKKCGKEFEGKFCPNCGTPADSDDVKQVQNEPSSSKSQKKPKKKKGCWIAGIIILIILIIIIIATQSCNSSQPTTTTSSGSSNTSETESQSKPESKLTKTTFKIGETVKYNGLELTVTKFTTSQGTEFEKPKSGMEYAIVTVKYKNSGKENISYNLYDFKMKNSKGQITDCTIYSNLKHPLESGDLAPGGEIEGEMPFEEPKGDKGLILQYTGNIFESNSQMVVSIEVCNFTPKKTNYAAMEKAF